MQAEPILTRVSSSWENFLLLLVDRIVAADVHVVVGPDKGLIVLRFFAQSFVTCHFAL